MGEARLELMVLVVVNYLKLVPGIIVVSCDYLEEECLLEVVNK